MLKEFGDSFTPVLKSLRGSADVLAKIGDNDPHRGLIIGLQFLKAITSLRELRDSAFSAASFVEDENLQAEKTSIVVN